MLPPRSLFKYRPIYHANGHTEDIFRNRRLFLPAPAAFNDPFDCNLPLRFEGTECEWHEFAAKLASEENFAPAAKERAVAAIMSKRPWENPGVFQEIMEKNREKVRSQSSVLCWAAKPDDILMFAYYAAGHTGICLEFQVGWEHEIGQAVPVEYPPDYPDLNYIRVRDRLTEVIIFRKAPFWAHEGELRVFRYGEPPGFIQFQPDLLKRVIFGAEAPSGGIALVKSWCEGWGSPIRFARAKPREDSFALIIEDFETVV